MAGGDARKSDEGSKLGDYIDLNAHRLRRAQVEAAGVASDDSKSSAARGSVTTEQARRAVARIRDFRIEKVHRLREAIAAGQYRVDARAIADRLLDDAMKWEEALGVAEERRKAACSG